jgi:hypothetical protein
MSDDGIRTLCDRVAGVLLEAAGASGTIQVSLRIFPESAEVDVLFAADGARAVERFSGIGAGAVPDRAEPARAEPARAEPDMTPGAPSFAAWLSGRLRAEGMTMEAAARRLDVSTKTISRWVGGTTEPRLRDLYRIRDVFGEPPFH